LISQLSAGENELVARVAQEQARVKNLTEEVNNLVEQLLKIEAEKHIQAAAGDLIVLRLDKSFGDVQMLARQMLDLGAQVLLLSSLKENKLFFCHNGTINLNCGQLIKEGLGLFPGKGGGGPRQAQAALENSMVMEKFEKYLVEKVEKSI